MFKSAFIQIKKDPALVLTLIKSYFRSSMVCGALFMTPQELLETIRSGKSIIRLGDGDLGILHGKSIFHQPYNSRLEYLLREIITNYNDSAPYVLLIPTFVNISNSILRARNVLICWIPFKVEFERIFNKKAHYGDAHSFYHLSITRDLFETYIKHRDTLFVSNAGIIEKLRQSDLDQQRIRYIETPDLGTFDILDSITQQIDSTLATRPATTIVFACGSASRVLAYQYAGNGIQSLDLGRGINCYLDKKDYSDTIWATNITVI